MLSSHAHVVRNVWKSLQRPDHGDGADRNIKFKLDPADRAYSFQYVANRIAKTRHAHSLLRQSLEVYVRRDHLLFGWETFRGTE